MKLFGGHGTGSHAAQHTEPTENMLSPPVAKAAGEKSKKEKTDRKSLPPVFRQMGDWIKKHKIVFVVPGCVLLALLIVVLIYSVWEEPPEQLADGPKIHVTATPRPEENENVAEENQETTEEPEPVPTEPVVSRDENCYTFLVAANDQLGANTDVMLVGKLDLGSGELNIISLPRDTLVNVNWGVKKLNTVLANQGNDPENLVAAVSKLIGFNVDCYAVVDIRSVEKIVDCIGGVYYNVPRDMDYDDPTQELSIHISAGYQLLFGEDAVKVLRYREGNNGTGYVNGDLGRIATQQDFLMTLASQLLTVGNIPNLDELINIINEYVTTNMSANNIAFFAREFLLLDKDSIHFYTLPGDGISIRGGSYYEVRTDEWLEMVNTYLNPYNTEITRGNVDILDYVDRTVGAVSTSGETISIGYFYDFSNYTG